MMTRCGAGPCCSVARMISALVSLASSTSAVAEPEPLGAEPDLRHRLFARDVDDALARLAPSAAAAWSSSVDLPMPGIAADQHGRAHDEAAAEHAVEFGDAGGDARGALGLARERNEFNRPAARNCSLRARRRRPNRPAPRRSSSTRRRRRSAPPSACARRRRTGRRRLVLDRVMSNLTLARGSHERKNKV